MHVRTRTASILTVFAVSVSLTILLTRTPTHKEQHCGVEANAALMYQRVSRAFSPDEDGEIVKEVFAGERGRLFVRIFPLLPPERNPRFLPDAVVVFSTPKKTLLLFFVDSCLVVDTLVDPSVYTDMKAKIRENFREVKL